MTSRGFPLAEPLTVQELTSRVDESTIALHGDPATVVTCVAAFPGVDGALTFLRPRPDAAQQAATSPAAVIVAATPLDRDHGAVIQAADTMRWFIKALGALGFGAMEPIRHPTAVIDPAAEVADDVAVGPYAVIEAGVVIGPGCRIGAGTYLATGARIGARCVVGAGSAVGVDGLAVAREDDGRMLPFPHLGAAVLEDDVAIGVRCTIMRGILEDTVVGQGTKIGNDVTIGHNCLIGRDCWITSGALLCGSARVDDRAVIGAGAIVNNHVGVGANAQIGLGAVVTKAVAASTSVFGVPAVKIPTMKRF